MESYEQNNTAKKEDARMLKRRSQRKKHEYSKKAKQMDRNAIKSADFPSSR
jgi:hypothetical protein